MDIVKHIVKVNGKRAFIFSTDSPYIIDFKMVSYIFDTISDIECSEIDNDIKKEIIKILNDKSR